ncbi:MAG: hypothetical protein ACQ9MH_26370 [Nitrospinales bacterium]
MVSNDGLICAYVLDGDGGGTASASGQNKAANRRSASLHRSTARRFDALTE